MGPYIYIKTTYTNLIGPDLGYCVSSVLGRVIQRLVKVKIFFRKELSVRVLTIFPRKKDVNSKIKAQISLCKVGNKNEKSSPGIVRSGF